MSNAEGMTRLCAATARQAKPDPPYNAPIASSSFEHSGFFRHSSFVIPLTSCWQKFARQPLDKARQADEKITNFLLAISGPMFILGKNCGAFADGNLSGALPEENLSRLQ